MVHAQWSSQRSMTLADSCTVYLYPRICGCDLFRNNFSIPNEQRLEKTCFCICENSTYKVQSLYFLMCNSYSQIMVFPGYLLFHLILFKLFSFQNLALSLS